MRYTHTLKTARTKRNVSGHVLNAMENKMVKANNKQICSTYERKKKKHIQDMQRVFLKKSDRKKIEQKSIKDVIKEYLT